MRVCYLVPNLEVGGLQRAIVTIAGYAPREGVTPIVCSIHRLPYSKQSVVPALRDLGVELWDLDVGGRADRELRSLAAAAYRFRKRLRQNSVDIVDSAIFEADLVARFGMLGRPQPLVTHLVNTTHDVEEALPHIGNSRRRDLARRIDGITGRLATDHFVALTSVVAESGRRNLKIDSRKSSTIPRAVDLKRFEFVGPEERVRSQSFRFVCIGRLAPQKSISTVIAALAEIEDVRSRVRLTIYGDGPLTGELTSQARDLGLSDVVVFAGVASDISAIHHRSDALLFPSAHEGLGNTLIEAMACGTPTIASDIPVLREVGGATIAYATPGEPAAWAHAMESMMQQPIEARHRSALEARSRVADRYSPERNIGALFDLYRELLAKNSWS